MYDQEGADLEARTNYCRLMGHTWKFQVENGDIVIHCTNRCAIDGKYKAVPIEDLTQRQSK